MSSEVAPRAPGASQPLASNPNVVVRYLGKRIGKFTMAVGGREWDFSASRRDLLVPVAVARSLIGLSPAEFAILESSAPVPGLAPRARPRPVQSPPLQPQLVESPAANPVPKTEILATKYTGSVHRPMCGYYPKKPDITFASPEEALAAGFKLCRRKSCFPLS